MTYEHIAPTAQYSADLAGVVAVVNDCAGVCGVADCRHKRHRPYAHQAVASLSRQQSVALGHGNTELVAIPALRVVFPPPRAHVWWRVFVILALLGTNRGAELRVFSVLLPALLIVLAACFKGLARHCLPRSPARVRTARLALLCAVLRGPQRPLAGERTLRAQNLPPWPQQG